MKKHLLLLSFLLASCATTKRMSSCFNFNHIETPKHTANVSGKIIFCKNYVIIDGKMFSYLTYYDKHNMCLVQKETEIGIQKFILQVKFDTVIISDKKTYIKYF